MTGHGVFGEPAATLPGTARGAASPLAAVTASQLSKCSRTRAPCVIWELPKFEIGNNLADVFFEALCGVMGLAPHRYLSAASRRRGNRRSTGSQPSGPGASGPPSHYEHVQRCCVTRGAAPRRGGAGAARGRGAADDMCSHSHPPAGHCTGPVLILSRTPHTHT